MKTNLTIRVETGLVQAAKVLAARRGTSVSRLVAEELEQLVQRDRDYAKAKRQAFALMEKGIAAGWQKPATRDELHDR